mmetsp:Transcript_24615/g.38240  ORF Transcript_24615/g.38240 Transcript_24615/m.38240 type:complete len:220 (+) Transcript_24615:4983-5642(+)
MFKVKLQEKNKNFKECLDLFLKSPSDTNEERARSIFEWINTTFSSEDASRQEEFTKELKVQAKNLLELSSDLTVHLVWDKFNSEHAAFIEECFSGDPDSKLKYLEALMHVKSSEIYASIEELLLHGKNKEKADEYIKLQTDHLRLLCEKDLPSAKERVRQITKGKVHIPLEECLAICSEATLTEGCALLTSKMKNYLSSVTHYLSLLSEEHLDYGQFLH